MQVKQGMPTHLSLGSWIDLDSAPRRAARDLFVTIAGLGVAILLATISLGGLLLPSAYAYETANWRAQAVAQDWFDLVVAAPCLAAATIWAYRGSRRARLVQAGLLLFAVYTAVIYAFGVHLNALFLVYCATLGLALFALIALASRLRRDVVRFDARLPRRIAGGFLVGIGGVFALLWLAQLVPAAISGEPPRDLVETGLFTNPVHVLDLAFVLPLHVIAGALLWWRRPLGSLLAPGLLAFGALMSASIGFLMIWMIATGVASAGIPVAIAMAALAAASTALLALVLRSLRA